MKFSFPAFVTTVLLVAASGVVSLLEGTFTSKRVTMGFINHGGMWGDLIILSVMTGLVYPYFVRNRLVILSALFLALAVTILAHIQWANWSRNDGLTGHMFRSHETGIWYAEMSLAGWMHVIVMTVLLSVAFIYAVSSTPLNIVLTVSLLLTVHVFLGTVQPGWYCTGKLWTWRNFGPPLFATGLIWTV